MAVVGTIDVNGVDCTVSVTIHGLWEIRDNEGTSIAVSNSSLEDARAQARGTINKRKVKYSAPFVSRDGKPGEVYGEHSRTRKMLIKIGDQKMQEAASFRVFKPDINQAAIDQYKALNDRATELRHEISAIERTWCVSIYELAQAAIKEAVTAQAVKDALGETD